jgi:hypothetical protein
LRGCVVNGFEHRFRSLQNIVVPEAQHAKSALHQISIAAFVPVAFRVLASISFDDQMVLERNTVSVALARSDFAKARF